MSNKISFYILSFFSVLITVPSNVAAYQHYELSHDLTQEYVDHFCKPIEFTRSGMKQFFLTTFNSPHYSRDYLPHNFSHFIQMLNEGINNNLGIMYVESVIRMFINKEKTTAYISAYAFSDMLEYLPTLKAYCLTCSEQTLFDQAKDIIKDILYSFFLTKFSFFKTDPDEFFTEISEEIVATLHQQNVMHSNVEKEELRQTLIRFLEIGLMKLIWSPEDQEDIWDSVKKIADQLTKLYESNIINEDELDDLFKSLLESFNKFLELAGSELSLEVLNSIKEDISSGELLLFELDEQEDFLETKAERLACAIMHTEAKVRARLSGIITDNMIF